MSGYLIGIRCLLHDIYTSLWIDDAILHSHMSSFNEPTTPSTLASTFGYFYQIFLFLVTFYFRKLSIYSKSGLVLVLHIETPTKLSIFSRFLFLAGYPNQDLAALFDTLPLSFISYFSKVVDGSFLLVGPTTYGDQLGPLWSIVLGPLGFLASL